MSYNVINVNSNNLVYDGIKKTSEAHIMSNKTSTINISGAKLIVTVLEEYYPYKKFSYYTINISTESINCYDINFIERIKKINKNSRIFKNDLTEKLVKYLTMDNENLVKVSGSINIDIYRKNVLNSIISLFE